MTKDDHLLSFRCLCGKWVLLMHEECRARLPEVLDIEERER